MKVAQISDIHLESPYFEEKWGNATIELLHSFNPEFWLMFSLITFLVFAVSSCKYGSFDKSSFRRPISAVSKRGITFSMKYPAYVGKEMGFTVFEALVDK